MERPRGEALAVARTPDRGPEPRDSARWTGAASPCPGGRTPSPGDAGGGRGPLYGNFTRSRQSPTALGWPLNQRLRLIGACAWMHCASPGQWRRGGIRRIIQGLVRSAVALAAPAIGPTGHRPAAERNEKSPDALGWGRDGPRTAGHLPAAT